MKLVDCDDSEIEDMERDPAIAVGMLQMESVDRSKWPLHKMEL